MIKGFIFFRDGKIPFVTEKYKMELFTYDNLLKEFSEEYNYKSNYVLQGQVFVSGIQGRNATFLVEQSIGSTCYLNCYTVSVAYAEEGYDAIGFQSPYLDDVFRYSYNFLDMVRSGINISAKPQVIYDIPFLMDDTQYNLSYRIGHENALGLLEDFDRKGETMVSLKSGEILECYNLATVMYRLAKFMVSHANVPFKQISLYKNGWKAGWFYCPYISEDAFSGYEGDFFEFDVMNYIPRILNNVALDSGNKITKSIPLGHLGDYQTLFSPQRFLEQVMAFEYLFEKLEPKKAKDRTFPLKEELKYMFDQFPQLISLKHLTSEMVSEQIKEIRRTIAHGYAYYYDFKGDSGSRYLMILLDQLIECMSLKWMGFTKEEIDEYRIH